MGFAADLTGRRFGRLLVRNFFGRKRGRRYWLCECECGNAKSVSAKTLCNGEARSCGCLGTLPIVIGEKFSMLTVERRLIIDNRTAWLCQCECGNSTVAKGHELHSKNKQSCGCLGRQASSDRIRAKNLSHGFSGSPTWVSWRSMLSRCLNKKDKAWENYGGRGIVVCDRWQKSFKNFLSDVGVRPIGMTLDRIDVNGNYEPGNCKWATASEQQRNKRPAPRMLGANRLKQIEWMLSLGTSQVAVADMLGISASLVRLEIQRGRVKGWPCAREERKAC